MTNQKEMCKQKFLVEIMENQDYTGQIYRNAYLPYVVQLFCSSYFFFYFVPRGYHLIGNDLETMGLRSIILRMVTIVTLIYNAKLEFSQLVRYGIFEYLNDGWNILVIAQYVSITAGLIMFSFMDDTTTEREYLQLVIVCSFASLFSWVYFLYWQKLGGNYFLDIVVSVLGDTK